jgi:hypothetical protein
MFNEVFPSAIDNSIRKELVKCEQATKYKYIQGVRADSGGRVDLIAGGAFAAGMEAMRSWYYVGGASPENCLKYGIAALYDKYGNFIPEGKTNKTVDRMAGALAFYAQQCPLEGERLIPLQLPDGSRMIEVGFNFPIPIKHPDTQEPLTYCGRFDALCLDEHDVAWVVDEKTTSQMGEKWSNQWPLDSQMTGYVWGAERLMRQHGLDYEIGGAVINGIAIRLRDYEHVRIVTYRQPWEVERWFNQMIRDVERLKLAYQSGNFDMALDHACAFYNNPCEYAPLCLSRNPERLLQSGGWKEVRWNPVTREET